MSTELQCCDQTFSCRTFDISAFILPWAGQISQQSLLTIRLKGESLAVEG